jgi:hypothetical protein
MSLLIAWVLGHVVLAIAGGLVLLCIVAAAAYVLGKRLLRCGQKFIVWVAAKRRGFKAWLARFCRSLLPYTHSALKALLYIVLILTASVAAPQLEKWIGDALSLLLPNECEVLRNCLTISVVAGSSTALLFIFVREKPLSFANRILARLSGSVNTCTSGMPPETVKFVPCAEAQRLTGGKREYFNIECARRGVDEWMLILPQISTPSRKYTIECIEQQLNRVQELIEKENEKRERNCREGALEVKWVCFVSSDGGFHAFQPYKTFCFHIQVKHNSRYAAILNSKTKRDLTKAIQTEIDLTQRFKITDPTGTEREAFVPDAIPDLDKTWLRKGAKNSDYLEILVGENKGKAMLVTGCGNSEPIGVLTSTELTKFVLYEPLTDCALYLPHVVPAEKGRLYGDSPPP